MPELLIRLSSNFYGDPLCDWMERWSQRLGLAAEIQGPVAEALFEDMFEFASNARQATHHVLFIRPDDKILTSAGEATEAFRNAVTARLKRSQAPCLAIVAPVRDSDGSREQALCEFLTGEMGVSTLTPEQLNRWYPVSGAFDADSERLAGVPYSDDFYVALSTAGFRFLMQSLLPPVKVVAVDCDDTLWTGVVGEDGSAGVAFGAANLALQKRLVELESTGKLVCLLSKNREEDVWEVFEHRQGEMPLARSHVADSQVNWKRKSENLLSLSGKLSLGTDSFVFVDDNPAECDEVRSAVPESAILNWSGSDADKIGLLEHFWPFDHFARLTAADAGRTRLYQEEAKRARLLESGKSYDEYLEELSVRVELRALNGDADVERAAQLTHRTNQFNFSTQRRSAAQIRELRDDPKCSALAVWVSDRYGDYGFSGLLIFRASTRTGSLNIDTFLLSCRVLGRGVEHQVTRQLVRIAERLGLASLVCDLVPSGRNQPAVDFVASLPGGAPSEQASSRKCWSLADLREIKPSVGTGPRSEAVRPSKPPKVDPRAWQEIASTLRTVRQIREGLGGSDASAHRAALGGGEGVEQYVLARWKELLHSPGLTGASNICDSGATSLQLVRFVVRVRKDWGRELDLGKLFSDPTISAIARCLAETNSPSVQSSDPGTAPRGRESASLGRPALVADGKIRTIAIPTASDAATLLRSAESYLDNAKSFGRDLELVVMHDCDSRDSAADARQAMEKLSEKTGFTISFGDIDSRRIYVQNLAKEADVSPELAWLAIGKVESGMVSAGACRNALILETLGRRVLFADDDTICAPIVRERSLDIIPAEPGDPCGYWFFGSREEQEAFCKPELSDYLAAHEHLLGRSFRLKSGRSCKVDLTFGGIAGDHGWGSPFGFWPEPMGYLMHEGESLARLTSSERAYRDALRSREILRVAPGFRLADGSFGMTTVFAADNHGGLPPFLPYGRGQDLVFVRLLEALDESTAFGHVPFAIRHYPATARKSSNGELLRSAGATDLSMALLLLLRESSAAASDNPKKTLVREFEALGGAETGDFVAYMDRLLATHYDQSVAKAESLLSSRSSMPSFWRADLKAYCAAARERARANPPFPLDFTVDDRGEAWRRFQKTVGDFGKLIGAWDQLQSSAKRLTEEGRGCVAPVIGKVRSFARRPSALAELSPVDLMPLVESESGPLVVCLPPLGGESLFYFPLVLMIGTARVLGFKLNPVYAEAVKSTSFEQLAGTYRKAIELRFGPRPITLMGYSYGGNLAYEVARQLSECGWKQTRVILIDTAVDMRRLLPRVIRLVSRCLAVSSHFVRLFATRPGSAIRSLARRTEVARRVMRKKGGPFAKLLLAVHALIGDPEVPQKPSEIPDEIQEMSRIHSKARSDYFRKPYGGRLLFIRADKNSLHGLFSGWKRFAKGSFEEVIVKAAHNSIVASPQVEKVAEIIRGEIALDRLEKESRDEDPRIAAAS